MSLSPLLGEPEVLGREAALISALSNSRLSLGVWKNKVSSFFDYWLLKSCAWVSGLAITDLICDCFWLNSCVLDFLDYQSISCISDEGLSFPN